jgi:putative FmdB family regulatory protein
MNSSLDNANLRDYDSCLWEDDMPIYEYQCSDCGQEEEVLQRVSDPVLTRCPKCGGAYHKKISSPAFQFKGSGFYETDYKKSSHATDTVTADSVKKADKSETKSESESETKSEAKPETSSPKTDPPKEKSLVS